MEVMFVNYGKPGDCKLDSRRGLGISYLVSFLKSKLNLNISYFDFIFPAKQTDTYKDIEKRVLTYISNNKPSYACFSFFYEDFDLLNSFIIQLKNISFNTKIVVGGILSSSYPKEILEKGAFIDYIIIGEAELPLYNLFSGKQLNKIKGIAYRSKKKTIINSSSYFIDLDTLPFPDRDILDNKFNLEIQNEYFGKRKFLNILGSRGCNARCNFCSHPFSNNLYRQRSSKNIIEELVYLVKKYNIRNFIFNDINFDCSKRRLSELCLGILKRKELNKIRWTIETRAQDFDMDSLVLLKKAGCYKLSIGIESGSEKLLKSMKKGTNLSLYRRCCHLIKKAGIKLEILVMYGYIGETSGDSDKTINLIKEIKPDTIHLTRFMPLIGTRDYIFLVKTKKIEFFKNTKLSSKDYIDKINNLNYTLMSDSEFIKKKQELEEVCKPFQFWFVFDNLSFFEKIMFLLKKENLKKTYNYFIKNPSYLFHILFNPR